MANARTLPARDPQLCLCTSGISVDDWAAGGVREPAHPTPNCRQLMALLQRAPNPFVEKLVGRVNLVAASPWGIQLSAGFLA